MNTIVAEACELIGEGRPFVLATIVSHTGSTPRTAGSKMIVTADGRGIGTIGGGLLEAGAMARAKALIPQGRSAVIPFDLSDAAVTTMDMICGGQAEVLLDCVAPSEANHKIFDAWRQILDADGEGCFITAVQMEDDTVRRVSHLLADASGRVRGEWPFSDAEWEKVRAALADHAVQSLALGDGFVLLEPVVRVSRLHLFGAGHVARPTAHLAALVDFRVHVYDDRREFANRERFPDAHAVRVLEDFGNGFGGRRLTGDDFVVIVTRGHLHDQHVLAGALTTGAGYVGMIGSRRKRDTIYRNLRNQGVPQEAIDRVHCPIGMAIGAETPEEIAVSIVSELIAVRAGTQP